MTIMTRTAAAHQNLDAGFFAGFFAGSAVLLKIPENCFRSASISEAD